MSFIHNMTMNFNKILNYFMINLPKNTHYFHGFYP